jgi:anthranilate synthase component 1
MTSGAVSPDEATFRATTRRVVPVVRKLLADGETPVGVYTKLAGGPGTFLLESAEQGAGPSGAAWSRYSFVGVRSAATLVERNGEAAWLGTPPAGVPVDGDPVVALRETVAALADGPADADLPPLTGGMVGYLAYDLVRRFERLPDIAADDLALPELGMMLATDLVVLDHYDGSAILVANAILPEKGSPRVPTTWPSGRPITTRSGGSTR